MMQTLLANLRLWTGRLAEAEQLAERALSGFRESNDRYGVMQALGPLNRARAGLGKKADAKRGVEEGIALGKQFGELGLALQGAAGVAMHLGAGEQALTLAEQVIERNVETGTNQDEAHVLLALAQLPARARRGGDGGHRAGRRRRLPVRPRGAGPRARRRRRRSTGALADAEAVEATHGASYFDLALGRLAGVLAAGRAGDEVRSRHWLDLLGAPRLVGRRRRVRGHRPAPRGSPGRRGRRADVESSPLAPGWRRIVDSVVVG